MPSKIGISPYPSGFLPYDPSFRHPTPFADFVAACVRTKEFIWAFRQTESPTKRWGMFAKYMAVGSLILPSLQP